MQCPLYKNKPEFVSLVDPYCIIINCILFLFFPFCSPQGNRGMRGFLGSKGAVGEVVSRYYTTDIINVTMLSSSP